MPTLKADANSIIVSWYELHLLKDVASGHFVHGLEMVSLILMGLVSYRRRYFLFGEKVIRITRLGRAVLDRHTQGKTA